MIFKEVQVGEDELIVLRIWGSLILDSMLYKNVNNVRRNVTHS